MKIQLTLFFFILFSISVIGQTVQPLEKREIQAIKSMNSRNLSTQTWYEYVLGHYCQNTYDEMYRVLRGIKAFEYIDNSDCDRFGNSRKYPNQLGKTRELEPELRSFSFLDLSQYLYQSKIQIMKTQFTIFLFLIIAIPSFGQNVAKNTNQEIKQLPHIKIKPVTSEIDIYCDEGDSIGIRSCYSNQKTLYINGYNWSEISKSIPIQTDSIRRVTCIKGCFLFNPKAVNQLIKKRYSALKERHSSRYPNNKSTQTPELQSTLKEIRF